MKPIFIAEIKTQSPFGFVSKTPFVSLMECAIRYGDWISVHTNALWGGDYDAISFVRRNTNKPILAKGIHASDDDVKRAIDHGADYVLVVDRLPQKNLTKCLLEFSNLNKVKELSDRYMDTVFSSDPILKFICNSRDLRSGLPKKMWELDEYLKIGGWVCQASGIKSKSQVDNRVDAFIVGEHLIEFCKTL